MGSASVRAAVATYLEQAMIPGLNRVHTAPPFWADGSEWDLATNLGSGAIAGLHIIEESESRLTVPVLTGQKMVTYRVGLMVFYQWLKPSNTLVPVDEAAWSDPLDVILDGIKAQLRADPNCGVPGTVWQSAQDPEDLKIQRDIPRQMAGKVLAWNVVEWTVIEVITA